MSTLAGSFLVARHVLKDPNFRRTVVLLLQHGAAGAFGLVVNRPADVSGALPFPVFRGGPCPAEGLLMLHGQDDWVEPDEENPSQVAPGVFLGDAACLERATESPTDGATRYRVFVGYAGWGPGQLEGELASGAWAVARADGELLFDVPPGDLWERLAPPALPQPSLN
jgi:putative transcriptional regulator